MAKFENMKKWLSEKNQNRKLKNWVGQYANASQNHMVISTKISVLGSQHHLDDSKLIKF